MTIRYIHADVLDGLAGLPDESVQCVITSPPYWGLRDYGVVGQIGLEPSLDEHIERLISVFREVRRVLKPNGTLWVNYADGYATTPNGRKVVDITQDDRGFVDKPITTIHGHYKPKDLIPASWLLAIALQKDGWWLRAPIIWAKPNPMPSSVKDRPGIAHEYVFLLSKSANYFYDHQAVRQPAVGKGFSFQRVQSKRGIAMVGQSAGTHRPNRSDGCVGDGKRNLHSVWNIATKPFKGAHFATFPPKLVEMCLLAGTQAGDVVLDPFGGAGTVGLVASQWGRGAILIELSSDYVTLSQARIEAEGGRLL